MRPTPTGCADRTPITDGASGEPWVFRFKDIVGWWRNAHHDRPGGVSSATPTAWMPQSKPIWFTELGCPAIDKGANQPNVFPDPKSSESRCRISPPARPTLMQRRFLAGPSRLVGPGRPVSWRANPISAVYGGPMLDADRIYLWTWDARPYPAFPVLADVWADAANYAAGHWLTGRLGAPPADKLVAAILEDYGIPTSALSMSLTASSTATLVGEVGSARQALEPLAQLLMFEAFELGETIRFVRRGRKVGETLVLDQLAEEADTSLWSRPGARRRPSCRPKYSIGFADTLADFRTTSVSSRRLVTGQPAGSGDMRSAR